MRRTTLIAMTLALVAGCATTPQPIDRAAAVPAERVFLRSAMPPANGSAKAVFVRDTGFVGSGVSQHLYINGVKAASIDPGEKVEFALVAGEYIFGAVPTDPFDLVTPNSIDQTLQAGRSYFYRIKIEGDSMRTSVERFIPR